MQDISSVNLGSIDLNLLVTLDAVLSTRSATVAASRLHITQSAVSNALRRARALFGDALVVRKGSGFSLTPRADALAPALRAALDELRRLVAGDAHAPRWVSIACLDAVAIALLPGLLPRIAARLPGTRLRTLTPEHVHSVGLERSDVDLIVGAPPEPPRGCEAEALFEDPMVVIAARRHPAIKSRLSLEAYARLQHAELGLFGEPEDRVDRALAALGRSRRIEVVVPHLTALPFLVAGSERLATVTRSVAQRFAGPLDLALYRPPIALPPVIVKMVWHRRRAADPTHLALRELVRTAARGMTRAP
jgi:DNA-binding transcriptional LysR family regulator